MKITVRPYMYKTISPSMKNKVLTTYKDGDDPRTFTYFETAVEPLATTDTEISNKYRELFRKTAEKMHKEFFPELYQKVEDIKEED